MTQVAPIITEILSRVESLTKARPDLSPTKLSKTLFGSGHALGKLGRGERVPGLDTVANALQKLDAIEKETRKRARSRVS